jgi:threonine efflux protein
VLGLAVAVWFWCAAVLCGLTVLFRLFPWLYGILKIAGGCYLVFIGVTFWRGAAGANSANVRLYAQSGFMKGLSVGLTNPKAVVYFGSIFTLFVKPGAPAWFQLAAVGVATFDTLVWFGLVAMFFSHASVRAVYDRVRRSIGRITGAGMMAFGARLIVAED